MEFNKEQLSFLLKVLSQNESEIAKNLSEKLIDYQKSAGLAETTDDQIALIKTYRIALSEVMKEMRAIPHDSSEADVLSRRAEQIIRDISELESKIQAVR